MKRLVSAGVLVLLLGTATLLLLRQQPDRSLPPSTPAQSTVEAESKATPRLSRPTVIAADRDPIPAGRVGAGLNAQDGTARRDLEILQGVLQAWQRMANGAGNPTGTNRAITAALTGQNPWRLVFIPPDHPAIDAEGLLCDRWGSPLFFHQISGDHMELRSYGPDRQPYTDDDLVF